MAAAALVADRRWCLTGTPIQVQCFMEINVKLSFGLNFPLWIKNSLNFLIFFKSELIEMFSNIFSIHWRSYLVSVALFLYPSKLMSPLLIEIKSLVFEWQYVYVFVLVR